MNFLKKLGNYTACIAGLVMFFTVNSAQALTVDPTIGDSGFSWWNGGIGSSQVFTDNTVFSLATAIATGDDTLEVTVASDSVIDFSVLDCCTVGDAFALIFDGSSLAWTTSGFTGGPGGTYFEATILDLFLSTGMHTIDLITTATAIVVDSDGEGTADWTMSAATPVAPIPLPAALPLFASGLGLLSLFGWRRNRKDA